MVKWVVRLYVINACSNIPELSLVIRLWYKYKLIFNIKTQLVIYNLTTRQFIFDFVITYTCAIAIRLVFVQIADPYLHTCTYFCKTIRNLCQCSLGIDNPLLFVGSIETARIVTINICFILYISFIIFYAYANHSCVQVTQTIYSTKWVSKYYWVY